ncbi:phenylalanyl-tRNA synthetase alpha chain [Lentisphaera araneosa HTCC2155]|uniref:Phenylalanine--tRNA ligase alpha subunit n=1 Tax=Lentisphaera araneosa HTCC2155 TaxID=313628 RepID=A6DPQ2_9BACT|nr:phenylalanine--tRNA ligase subunit alpha [Lentisphaera araneosa]EDM26347.1 phenylalanyl-tRNA synthetase alpha chain [Lentisphaera araneosa HTCC2155]
MIEDINKIVAEFTEKVNAEGDLQALEQIKAAYMGKKGPLTGILKNLRNLSPEEKSEVGQAANKAKTAMQEVMENRRQGIIRAQIDEKVASEWVDFTLDEDAEKIGALHPVSQMQYEIEDIFSGLGFTVQDGPHCELDFYNFEALNIPADHPARDMQDTFYFENGAILRTHTSAIQARAMERIKPPFKIIGPGKVFRVERLDASHEAAFHQLEGMVVDEDISVANLIHTMKTLLSEIFQKDIKVRLRPGYFPFVEPGFELDINCQICNGKGCSVCKQTGWLELMPCGMVHPNVLKAGGIDTEKFTGFAFGLGLDRLVMMRHKIEDIRHLHSGDLRFSSQFK